MNERHGRHRRSASVSASVKNKMDDNERNVINPPKIDLNRTHRSRKEEKTSQKEHARVEEESRERHHRHHRRSQSEKRPRHQESDSQKSSISKISHSPSVENHSNDTVKQNPDLNQKIRHRRSPSEPSHRKPILDQIRETENQKPRNRISPASPTDSIKSVEADRILSHHVNRLKDFQINSPAESAKSFHHKPPPLPLDTPEKIPRSSQRRSASEKTHRRRRQNDILFQQEQSQKKAKEEQDLVKFQSAKNEKPGKHKLLELHQKQVEMEQKAPISVEQKPDNKPKYKSFKEILSEKPRFKSKAAPKPLIGTENDNILPHFPLKPQLPMTKSISSGSVEDQPDDYNARDINKQIQFMERESFTLQPNGKRKPKGHVKLEFSAKDQKLKEENEKEKSNDSKEPNDETPKSDIQDELMNQKNISIDGKVIEPPPLQVISSSSDFNAMTGTELEETTLQFHRGKSKPQYAPKKKKYRPPELKIFDSQDMADIHANDNPFSAQIPKADIKFPFQFSASPPVPRKPLLQAPLQDGAPQQPSRSRRRREHH